MDKKDLYNISWRVTEEEYRKDTALSYSTLARFEREGFNNLDKLFERVESPSLTFGSAVDSIITGGQEEFDSRFIVADFPIISDTIIKIVKSLFAQYGKFYSSINDINDEHIIEETLKQSYQLNWKPETRAKVIKEKGVDYYNLLFISEDKTIIDSNTYQDVCNAVNALKESPSTKFYFADNNPFEPEIKRYYQLKFKECLNGIWYRCMFDELLVSYKDKTIQPIDLKTSFKKEWDFYKSFVEWNYQIQNRLYVRILQEAINKDEYFKDFTILPYKDIVVCKTSLTPLVWDCDFTFEKGNLKMGKENQIIFTDPEIIGKELSFYLTNKPNVPIGIEENKSNDLKTWLNTL